MLGTIINTLAILCGGVAGLYIKGGLKDQYRETIMDGLGLAVLFIGAVSAIGGLLDQDANPILFIVSMVIGCVIGTFLNIEGKLDETGQYLQKKFGGKDSNIAAGFVAASLLFCVGTMAILGSLESGIQGNHTTLLVKSVLDGVSAIIFASTLGVGVLFSAVSVLLYQGALTLLASFLQPYLTADMIREISIVGGILIFGLGLNMLGLKKIKVANFLPGILVPVIYYVII